MEKVGVVGVGYVGLTQAIGMASLGHSVVAYDIDTSKINNLKQGISPFYEPGLDELLEKYLASKAIEFTNEATHLISCEFIFLCLPTPQGEDGSADMSHLLNAARDIAPLLRSATHLIIKSTVPVNSWKELRQEIQRNDIHIVSNPEFLREGSALVDFNKPDRIVIGASDESVATKIANLYKGINTNFVITDNTSAELIKYASNSFLAIKLSFVNDIAALCENLSAQPEDVLYGVGLDNRIGNKFLTPGPGWGGSCFPKDVRALAKIADNEKLLMPLLTAAIESNENAHARVVAKITKHFGENLNNIKIAVLGLTFKANTDDIRNSPAIEIIKKLINLGAQVLAYDPAAKQVQGINQTNNMEELFKNADLLLVLTEWKEFSNLQFDRLMNLMKNPAILDTRKIVDFNNLREIEYLQL